MSNMMKLTFENYNYCIFKNVGRISTLNLFVACILVSKFLFLNTKELLVVPQQSNYHITPKDPQQHKFELLLLSFDQDFVQLS